MTPNISITNVNVIDGLGGVTDNATVVVSGSSIQSVTHANQSTAPSDGTRTIDGTGRWLMPGLINCHDHLCNKWLRTTPASDYQSARLQRRNATPGTNALEAAGNATWELRQGVTTVRELGGPGMAIGQEMFTNVDIRDAIAAGRVPGPRVLASRLIIAMTGGHGTPWYGVREADGPDEVRKSIREQLKGGADCIKIMSTAGLANYPHESPDTDEYTLEELTAGADEAHRFNKLITTHAMSDSAVRRAIKAGVDTIEHAFLTTADGVAAMADGGVSFVPTARVAWRMARNSPPALAELLESAGHRDRVLEAVDRGVRVGVGTDSRFTVLEEMETLVDYGMPVESVLRGATGVAAEICGLDDSGVVAPGKRADLLVLGANPLDGLRPAFEQLETVIKAGEVVVSTDHSEASLRPLPPPQPLN
ncbi:MAG: amidohydrolase family protein [Chloroflexi bacterium]|nr:amidohydrolase family protein [Chloroflexota bacterium]MBT4073830.1 amidohydrolase family protein [Chloroflexota bacterium]MBT4516127.1 amidohydrolase family protein [Chloroflexota bacterium]MBT5320003.1 amidohydrolase family protein [Chloroflexota bacterium]MBT6682260.1 amidohydrolase family protein [Chloroflexota bacterium]